MKRINLVIALVVVAVLLSITALSQLQSPITNTITKNNQITPSIGLEEKDTCTTTFYDETEDVFGNCIYYQNYTYCSNVSGANTGCSIQQNTRNFQCATGTTKITKNTTECKPDNNFVITIDHGAATLKKQVDYSNWGPCIYETQNSCLIVTCVSNEDGAFKGQFTDCNGGKSCQRFEICDNSIKSFVKNSRDDFVADDPSFYLSKLVILEVGQ